MSNVKIIFLMSDNDDLMKHSKCIPDRLMFMQNSCTYLCRKIPELQFLHLGA